MTTSTTTNTHTQQLQSGLACWMDKVLIELDSASRELAPDPVHNLRVAVRRCRSIAEGLRSIDCDPTWKHMRRAGKELFAALGGLRDVQVLMDLVQTLGSAGDSATNYLLHFLRAREPELKVKASEALRVFDRKQWKIWAEYLTDRMEKLRFGPDVFAYLVLSRWHAAFALHGRALRSGNQLVFHDLRIALKKFRYAVENFLPVLHERWGKDLKKLQDVLGEAHDLDVLWEAAVSSSVLADTEAFSRWRYRILEERQKRIQTYREVMVGKRSLWRVWRAELPQGNEVQKATIAALAALVHSFKAQPEHAERVARLSVEIYDGLSSCGIFRPSDAMPRLLLQSAALMHEIGRTRRKKGHHKISGRLISKMSTPVGWKTSHVYITALVARYHRGALPQIHHNLFCELSPENRQLTRELAAVLRLADSLDRTHSGMINKITVQKTTETLLVHAEGYSPDNQHAEKVAAARHLLETTTGLPCIIHRS